MHTPRLRTICHTQLTIYINVKKIIAVEDGTYAVAESKSLKKFRFAGKPKFFQALKCIFNVTVMILFICKDDAKRYEQEKQWGGGWDRG